MTVREVASRLEVSVSLAYGLVASGKLTCSRHGLGRGVIRVSEEQLAAYLSSVETRGRGVDLRPPGPRIRLRHLKL